jgi:hypothetical protein
MIGSTGTISAMSLLGKVHGKAVENSYCHVMSGVSSAEITIFPFAFGKVAESGTVYRKFFYNSIGKVVKKFCFDKDGNIEMRESYEFNSKGKNLHGHFITNSSITQEKYVYDDKEDLLTTYLFSNHNWASRKREVYEHDNLGRKVLKTSYGLMDTPEMITHYIYDDESWKYRFRRVTKPNGDLIATFLFTNDEKGNLDALYSFNIEPQELKELMTIKGWELESNTRTRWKRDSKENPILMVKDEKAKPFNLLFASSEYGSPEEGRITTRKSTSHYKLFNKRNYLVETVEWLPRFNEALKEVKKYEYYDNENKLVDLA